MKNSPYPNMKQILLILAVVVGGGLFDRQCRGCAAGAANRV